MRFFQAAARRTIAQRLPETVASAVLEFCDAALADNPHRVGKPLYGPLAGCHGARHGTYRSVYRFMRTAASYTSSTSTTARRSTTARNHYHQYSAAGSSVMPDTGPNGGDARARRRRFAPR
jgi:mRNA-degrading endonuclease RelE of RelBE toxin-antitoxin system